MKWVAAPHPAHRPQHPVLHTMDKEQWFPYQQRPRRGRQDRKPLQCTPAPAPPRPPPQCTGWGLSLKSKHNISLESKARPVCRPPRSWERLSSPVAPGPHCCIWGPSDTGFQAWNEGGTPFHSISTNTAHLLVLVLGNLGEETPMRTSILAVKVPIIWERRVRQGGKEGPQRKTEMVQNNLKFV